MGIVFIVSAAALDENVNGSVKKAVGVNVSDSVKGFVDEFVGKRGIDPGSIRNVSQVDFEKLPKEVNIKGVDKSNLAIYQVDYENPENKRPEKVFVIGYSVEKLKAQGDLIVAHDRRNFLDFGSAGLVEGSAFLNTAAGVGTDIKKGYVMAREGSITALSTNLEIVKSNSEGVSKVEIIVLKNGEPIRFGNTLDASSLGVKKDHDVQSKDVVTFRPGDVISAYAQTSSGVGFKDSIVLVEITTND